ncbi:hypothetical protein HMPREF1486_06203 [Streptomyces sp. HPH0547]|uniref:DUF4244 domain-containing protein n=1 Tax=Streptomyces sp. HPH0547 TaxID=1203592 RepID=UPI00034E0FDB|nr:DUF4244 domain-containing protein [Streptomyces sp. HPH0547]EPD89891.1 hypothetical protein HMPREF1486_06203 [Streptomyces sp. HPH0547]
MSEKVRRLWKRALAARKPRGDRGMSTAEYAIGTLVIWGCQAKEHVSRVGMRKAN